MFASSAGLFCAAGGALIYYGAVQQAPEDHRAKIHIIAGTAILLASARIGFPNQFNSVLYATRHIRPIHLLSFGGVASLAYARYGAVDLGDKTLFTALGLGGLFAAGYIRWPEQYAKFFDAVHRKVLTPIWTTITS